jgi:hypothetical protein
VDNPNHKNVSLMSITGRYINTNDSRLERTFQTNVPIEGIEEIFIEMAEHTFVPSRIISRKAMVGGYAYNIETLVMRKTHLPVRVVLMAENREMREGNKVLEDLLNEDVRWEIAFEFQLRAFYAAQDPNRARTTEFTVVWVCKTESVELKTQHTRNFAEATRSDQGNITSDRSPWPFKD